MSDLDSALDGIDEDILPAKITVAAGMSFDDPDPPPTPDPEPAPAPAALDPALLQQTVEMQAKLIDEFRKSQRPAPAAQAAPAIPPSATFEQLQELYERSPLEAIAYLVNRRTEEVERNVTTRMGSFASAAANQAELSARAKHDEVFTHYGEEMTQLMGQVDPSQRADPETWDRVAKFVLGNHLDDVIARRTAKVEADTRQKAKDDEAARVTAASRAGRPGRAAVSPSGSDPTHGLSAAELRAAEVGGMTPDEYARIKRATRGTR